MSTNRNSDGTRALSGNDISRKTQDQESAPLNRPDMLARTTSMVDDSGKLMVDENLRMPRRVSKVFCGSSEILAGSSIFIKSDSSKNLGDSFSKIPEPETDGKVAWLMLAAAMPIVGSTISITPTFGILFSEKMRQIQLDQTTVAWIFSIHGIFWNVGQMVTNYFTGRFTHRVTGMVTSFILSVSFMLLGLANTAVHFFILFGVIIPISAGMSSSTVYLVVPLHFLKRRGMAMGILASGISLGGIIVPLMIRGLQDEYGYLGACLIHGAILLNCCANCGLFRLPRIQKAPLSSIKSNANKRSLSLVSVEETCSDVTQGKTIHFNNPVSPLVNDNSNAVSAADSRRQNGSIISVCDNSPIIIESSRKKNSKERNSVLIWAMNVRNAFKNPRVLMCASSFAFSITGFFNLVRILPFYLEEQGHSKQFSAKIISVWSGCSMAARLLNSAISDQAWFSKRAALLSGVSFCGAVSFGLIYLPSSQTVILSVMVVHGLGQGLFISIYHVLLIEVIGIELYMQAVPVTALLFVFTYGMFGAISALLEMATTWYGATIAVTAVMQTSAALLWVAIILFERRKAKATT